MRKAIVLVACAISLVQAAAAQITVHDFKIGQRNRSQALALLIEDAAKTYHNLANLNLRTIEEERAALLLLGNNMKPAIRSFEWEMDILSKWITRLETGSYTQQEKALMIASLKKQVAALEGPLEQMHELRSLAKRSYRLSRAYEPARSMQKEWRATWKTVKRLVPQMLSQQRDTAPGFN